MPQIRGLSQASENVQDGISYVQVADGALAEIDEMLHRMTELCVKAATETLTEEDRQYIDREIQQLKLESNRTFHTTTFNDKLIWDENTTDRKVIGHEWRSMYDWTSDGVGYVNDTNKGAWPIEDGFKITVTNDKAKVSWQGYDGVNYESREFDIPDLETLKEKGFKMTFDNTTMDYDKYPSARGIDPAISLTIDQELTREQFIQVLNGKEITVSREYGITGELKLDSSKTITGVTMWASGTINYLTGLVTGMNLDGSDDGHIEPDPETGLNRPESGRFNFTLTTDDDTISNGDTFKGHAEYGKGSDDVRTYCHDYKIAENEGTWWYKDEDNVIHFKYYEFGGDNLDTSIANALTNETNNSIVDNSAKGGTLQITFDLKSDEAVKYSFTDENDNTTEGTKALTKIGTMYLYVDVDKNATAQNVIDAIGAIQGIDIKTNSNNTVSLNRGNHVYNGPVYGGTMQLDIQAGADNTPNDRISIIYDVLNNHSLKINDLKTLTVEDAQAGIDKVKAAQKKVDEQRALFGAYQNRMEHTVRNLDNIVENTQNAESLIRDTDMAKEMVKFANNNILAQAGQSILAQANQTSQGVMTLLQ